jgi:hypothetical protein
MRASKQEGTYLLLVGVHGEVVVHQVQRVGPVVRPERVLREGACREQYNNDRHVNS